MKSRRTFPGQRDHEEIILIIRKHWITDLKIAFLFLFVGVIPMITYLALSITYWPHHLQNYTIIIAFIFSFYSLFIFLFIYISWLNHELDLIIVTNERIINHDQVDFLHRQISETNLQQIQDIKGSEKGLLGNIFHFGVMEVRTAADLVVFRLKDATNPFENARKILDIRDKFIKDSK